jgi:hypothetical protein
MTPEQEEKAQILADAANEVLRNLVKTFEVEMNEVMAEVDALMEPDDSTPRP